MQPAAQPQHAFRAVMAAQFFSSLADNALLIAAIALLMERHAAAWMAPALRLFFYLAFVLLAAFAGAVADAWPKSRVILLTNIVKLAGCGLLLMQVHPLVAYGLIGLGAAAYSPARYGILPELLPPEKLVAANAWMEVSTVVAILLGVALGGLLLGTDLQWLPWTATPALKATLVIGTGYAAAVMCSALIPTGKASHPDALRKPRGLLGDFGCAFNTLWRDPESSISLAVSSLFWAAAAVLQFIVLRWAGEVLGLPLAQAALLQVAVAAGMVAGAAAAGRWVGMTRVLKVLPLGLALGAMLFVMLVVTQVWAAVWVLAAIGAMAGLFVVPMNALLQHRGQLLLHPGQSVAVQNFNECLASLLMLAVYGALLLAQVPVRQCIAGLGGLMLLAMLLIVARHRAGSRCRPRQVVAG